MAGQIEGKLHLHAPQAFGIPWYLQIINMSHGLVAILDWIKILNKLFLWTAASINVKLHNYDQVVMGNVYFEFEPDRTHGLTAIII